MPSPSKGWFNRFPNTSMRPGPARDKCPPLLTFGNEAMQSSIASVSSRETTKSQLLQHADSQHTAQLRMLTVPEQGAVQVLGDLALDAAVRHPVLVLVGLTHVARDKALHKLQQT